MNIRLVILIVALVIVGVVFLTYKKPTQVVSDTAGQTDEGELSEEELAKIRLCQKRMEELDLTGTECPTEAQLSVTCEVDTSDGKNRLVFVFTEANGYFVETIVTKFWKKGYENQPLEDFGNIFIEPNTTLRREIFIAPAEIASRGGTMGSSEDWEASIWRHGRCYTEIPDGIPDCPQWKRN